MIHPSNFAWWVWGLIALTCAVIAWFSGMMATTYRDTGSASTATNFWILFTIAFIVTVLTGIIAVVRMVKWVWAG